MVVAAAPNTAPRCELRGFGHRQSTAISWCDGIYRRRERNTAWAATGQDAESANTGYIEQF